MSCDIKIEDIKILFQYFRENMYKAKEYSRGTMVRNLFLIQISIFSNNSFIYLLRNSIN